MGYGQIQDDDGPALDSLRSPLSIEVGKAKSFAVDVRLPSHDPRAGSWGFVGRPCIPAQGSTLDDRRRLPACFYSSVAGLIMFEILVRALFSR